MSTHEVHWYWLGGNPVQSTENRIAVPEVLVTNEVLKTDRHVYWGFEEETRFVVVTRDPDLLKEDPEFRHRGSSKLGENRVMTVPAQFFDWYEGPAEGSTPVADDLKFTQSEYRVFVTRDDLYADNACYILTDKQARELQSQDVTMADGGILEADFAADSLRAQDHIEVGSREWDRSSPLERLEAHEIFDLSANEMLADTEIGSWYLDYALSLGIHYLRSPIDQELLEKTEQEAPEEIEMARIAPERYANVHVTTLRPSPVWLMYDMMYEMPLYSVVLTDQD